MKTFVIKEHLTKMLIKAALKEIEKNDNITFKELCHNISDGELPPERVRDLLKEAGFKFTKKMKVKITFEISGCHGCPYLKTGRTFGTDGRDGVEIFICTEGVYGEPVDTGYWTGLNKIPKITPQECPFNH